MIQFDFECTIDLTEEELKLPDQKCQCSNIFEKYITKTYIYGHKHMQIHP